MLTQSELKHKLHYNPLSGVFTWLVSAKKVKYGDAAGTLDKDGYTVIRIAGRGYKAHRLAFLYMTGDFPVNTVDHKDKRPSNNAWENLRNATHSQNSCNRDSKSKSGHKGVYWLAGKWMASVTINKKLKYLGVFSDIEVAATVANNARIQLHGDFARV